MADVVHDAGVTDAGIIDAGVLISANTEWRCVRALLPDAVVRSSPYGEWFRTELPVRGKPRSCVFLHGGWGKIAAAGSTQYAIDRWAPRLLLNLGTCGGFAGAISPGTVLLVTRTLVYDIIEQMGDPLEALEHYATDLDLTWLKGEPPQPVLRALLLSADRDIVMEEVPQLRERFGAAAADWESGAIAYVAARNGVRCLVLRAVTDVVGPESAEAYDGTMQLFTERTREVMQGMLAALPEWLALGLD
ncbi:MAG: 5'-methylthioadenosine/S-adenosylhomocysteine nucleosidase [Anaerolineae bacterium]|jgi:adenosylhomocysteine nucleosidase|nr:5'-methylthioadenosine/S-adenosylhomocysteine nucleosidase [Anaerolineae bacterium]